MADKKTKTLVFDKYRFSSDIPQVFTLLFIKDLK